LGLLARLLAGFAVAVVCTPAGVSGAFLLLPIQSQVFHVPSPAVSATNLVYNLVSAPAGALTYHRRRNLDGRLAVALCLGTTPGVVVGALVRSTWLADPARFGVLAGVLLILLGLRLVVERSGPSGIEGPAMAPPPMWRLTTVGLVAGAIGGIYGLGGAALIVPWLVSVERLPVARIAGAALVTTFVTSAVGMATFALASAAGFGRAAAPVWLDGLALGLGGLFGAVVGARLQPRLPVGVLRAVIAAAAIAAGVRMLG
jgi:uncharacterized membrane protein YfcA